MKIKKAKEITRKRISILEARLARIEDKTSNLYREIKEEKEALEMVLDFADSY